VIVAQTEVKQATCGKQRVLEFVGVPILEIHCTRNSWHPSSASPMLHSHYWSGYIDGTYVTVTWQDEPYSERKS